MKTITMYRPCNQKEMDLVAQSGYKKWPPRLPDQDIFYPVTTENYAHEVNAWNFKQFGSGYVTKFDVKQAFVQNYEVHTVGGSTRTEWWIPASDIEELNNNIVGLIEVLPNKIMKSHNITIDQIKGCLLGCAFGDALGASYEGGLLERGLWYFLGRKNSRKRFTDDTQMSLDIINSLLINKGINQNHLAQTFASNYKWSRGYGPGAARTLKKIRKGVHWSQANTSQFKEGSFGNGAAMRAPVLALFYSGEELKKKVKLASEITHAHPEAIEGAVLVALTASKALQQNSNLDILVCLKSVSQLNTFREDIRDVEEFFYDGKSPIKKITARLGNSIEAKNSCMTAICYALYFRDSSFLNMFEHIKNGKGDVDTIAAMAGAIWGCFNGFESMDSLELNQIELGESIKNLAFQIFEFNKQKEQV